jgi:type I restriction enzyme S subunit
MSSQMNVPKLRFPEFSGVWEEKTLGEVLSFKNGINATKEQYGKGYKFINVLDIINNATIKYDSIIGLVDVSKDIFEKNKVEYGNILFQRSSETRIDAGQSNVYLDENNTATFGGFVIRGQQKIDYNPEFMNYMFKTQHARKEISQKSNGSTHFNVGQETLSKVLVIFPSKPEQTKIATFLTAIDTKIDQLTKKQTLLKQYKKGVMQKLFSQELRFKADDGSEFSEWEEKKLGKIARITTGSSNRQDSNLDGEFTFFDRSQDIRTSDRFLFDAEAIIVPGEGQEFIPKYFKGKFDLHQRTYAIMDFKDINGIFLFYSISFNSNHLNSHAVGSTVKSLRLPMFETMPINLPSLFEQEKIANFLTAIDTKIDLATKQLEATKQFKKALLQQMFV